MGATLASSADVKTITICASIALAMLGCSGATASMTTESDELATLSGPDLRMNQIQMLATHNSYHKARPILPLNLDYSFEPLDVQLEDQGVRSFELDLNFRDRRFEVFHKWNDWRTTCRKLTDCLKTMKTWSDGHRLHHPLVVLLEAKDSFDDVDAAAYIAKLDEEILSVWPSDRLVTPDLVRGDSTTLRDAIVQRGWPSLASVRGRAMFVLMGSSELRTAYAHDGRSLDGRAAFVTSSTDAPYASFTIMDDPKADGEAIRAAVSAGFMVRTRADSGLKEPRANDYTRLEAALASGAHVVSTDFPAKVDDVEYVAQIPDGNPSRCNPVATVPGCTSALVEDLTR